MDKLTALSISIGVLAGIATFLAVGPANGFFFIWAATIPWAVHFLLGANKEAICKNIICSIFGVVMAWFTAMLLTQLTADGLFPLKAGFTVCVSVIVLCLAANIPQLSTIPCSVIGYSMTFAYLLQTPDKLNKDVLTGFTLSNPLLVITISIIVGTGLGVASVMLSDKLEKK